MKDYICEDHYPIPRYQTHEGHPHHKGVRCWKRKGHSGSHLAVIPPPDRRKDELTIPEVVRWGSPTSLATLG